jgi:hypothetical protein
MIFQKGLNKMQSGLLLVLFILLQLSTVPAIADDLHNEKILLKDSYFGNFTKAKIKKMPGNIKLEVWQPWIQHVKKNVPPQLQSALLNGPETLSVEYDEIWIAENNEGLTESEKKKYKNQLDILKMYWKNEKVQACTIEKFYLGNPLTEAPLSPPAHKITDIYDRSRIIQQLQDRQ